MGSEEDRKRFLTQVRKACKIAQKLRVLGIRKYGVVRIDSASSPSDWAQDPAGNSKRIADTFRHACSIAEDHGERLAAEGEICWGGMHSWKRMAELLEMVDRPKTLGFQADMAHTLLYTLGYNAPEDRILPENFDWERRDVLDDAIRKMRPAVKGAGSHDKTGRHCLPNDPKGKMDVPRIAGAWVRDDHGNLTRSVEHICWDGCMFSNQTMMQAGTWRDILSTMIAVRDAHGWN